jgi:hypothetical protein
MNAIQLFVLLGAAFVVWQLITGRITRGAQAGKAVGPVKALAAAGFAILILLLGGCAARVHVDSASGDAATIRVHAYRESVSMQMGAVGETRISERFVLKTIDARDVTTEFVKVEPGLRRLGVQVVANGQGRTRGAAEALMSFDAVLKPAGSYALAGRSSPGRLIEVWLEDTVTKERARDESP